MAKEGASEYELRQPPTDAISAVKFSPVGKFLLVSSWDSNIRLYDVDSNTLRSQYGHPMAALDCCFADNVRCFSGGLDATVRGYDFNTNSELTLGKHESAIKCIEFSSDIGAVITGSWDKTVQLWDPRQQCCVNRAIQPEKVFTMALSGERLVVGTANRKVLIWDLRNLSYVQQRRESSLKYQTRCIRAFPNKQGFALSSIEGRVAVEFFDPSQEAQKKKYAFKCHRIKEQSNNVDMIYPVHTIAFHQEYNTFATGGGDGYVNIWDGFNKKRLCQFHRYPTSISSLSFSADGRMLAIASSYMREDGEKESPADAIFVREVSDAETMPNFKKQQ